VLVIDDEQAVHALLERELAGCGSAWNVDPLSGEIGVQV
jgi:hypothetical protein